MKANEILDILRNLEKLNYKKILITGAWGIGKTKYALDYINEGEKLSNKKHNVDYFYVSLFGKKDISNIVEDIYIQLIANSKIKKYIRKLRKYLSEFKFSVYGVGLSIPFMEDVFDKLNKKLERKERKYIFIFDDLERKHDNLGIKEIFGLLESLSRNKNIKIVLVAAIDQLNDEDEKIFKEYQEKVIDKTYTIEEYSDSAPVEILGKEVWNDISEIIDHLNDKKYKLKNLRTFEKTNSFIKEVINTLGEKVFTDKFTKRDIYRMCFASVLFVNEHKGKKLLLDEEELKTYNDPLYEVFSRQIGSDVEILYLCRFILRDPMDSIHQEVFYHILNWYKTGACSKNKILKSMELIDKHEKERPVYYLSEQEVIDVIKKSREYLNNLNGKEPLQEIIFNVDKIITWSKVLSINSEIDIEEFIKKVNKNISNHIDLNKSCIENIEVVNILFKDKEMQDIVCAIEKSIEIQYYDKLINEIKDCYTKQNYSEQTYLKQLMFSILSIKKDKIRNKIIAGLRNNCFFFPIPSGSISEAQWKWCHLIKELLEIIEQTWNVNLLKELKSYVYHSEIFENDKMLQKRVKDLFDSIKHKG